MGTSTSSLGTVRGGWEAGLKRKQDFWLRKPKVEDKEFLGGMKGPLEVSLEVFPDNYTNT
jgi:hypothetical protein